MLTRFHLGLTLLGRAHALVRRRFGALALLASVGCTVGGCGGGTVERSEAHSERRPQPARATETTSGSASSARELGARATFAELVDAARTQDIRRDQESAEGCLLRVGATYRLAADLSAAVRPLPTAPVDLHGRLDRVAVVTRTGTLGDPAHATLVLVSMTTLGPLAPTAVGLVVVRKADGATWLARVRGAAMEGTAERVDEARLAALDDGASVLFVTAEAGVSVGDLSSLLRAIGPAFRGRVALAVATEEDTSWGPRDGRGAESTEPQEDAPPPPSEPRCELSDRTTGDPDAGLATSAIVPIARSLSSEAQRCYETVGAAADGHATLTFRIEPDGSVREACVSEDAVDTSSGASALDDGALRACLASAARALRFPSAEASTDIALPLRFVAPPAMQQTALCL